MFKKKHTQTSQTISKVDTLFSEINDFSSLPKAKEAFIEAKKAREIKKDALPILNKQEIIAEIKREISAGSNSALFFQKSISNEDKKSLEELGYEVQILPPIFSNVTQIVIWWNKLN